MTGRNFLQLALLFLSGCTNPSVSPPHTVATSVSSPVPALNPVFATDANSQRIGELIHSSLLTVSDNLQAEPWLAESFRQPSPTSVEFTLRKECRFHDGTPVRASDVVASAEHYLSPANNSPHREVLSSIAKVTAVSDRVVRFDLHKPDASLLSYFPLLKVMKAESLKSRDPEGVGPFRLRKNSTGEIILERSESGCLPAPSYRFLLIKVIRDDLSRYLKLKAGELDIALNEMDFQKIDWLLSGKETSLSALAAPGIGFNYLAVNFKDERLRDKRVRRALALSFDLESLIHYKSRNLATLSASILSPNSRWLNRDLAPIRRNLSEARRLLDEAGWSNGENGKPPLRIELKTTNNPFVIENARVLAAQAREAGIEIVHRPFEWGIFYQDVKSGNTQLYILRWVGVVDPGIYFEVFHSSPKAKSNRTRYSNPEMDQAIDKAMAATDFLRRKKLFDETQRIAAEDLPYINLWHNHNAAAFRKEISNVHLHTNGSWRTFLTLEKKP